MHTFNPEVLSLGVALEEGLKKGHWLERGSPVRAWHGMHCWQVLLCRLVGTDNVAAVATFMAVFEKLQGGDVLWLQVVDVGRCEPVYGFQYVFDLRVNDFHG